MNASTSSQPIGDINSLSDIRGRSAKMPPQTSRPVSVSVVSHLQGPLVHKLLVDLAAHAAARIEVLLTVNVPEQLPFHEGDFPMPIRIIRNTAAKGFGANHNTAFLSVKSDVFCVVNPDIRVCHDPFPALIEAVRSERVGVAAPLVEDPEGRQEDSARRFPTVRSLVLKALGLAPRLDYEIGETELSPDWVAGMFMLFRSEAFAAVRGFDERYFLYYEDVDICRRLRREGFEAKLVPTARVIHGAQRASRRSMQHVRWHLSSMCRFLASR